MLKKENRLQKDRDFQKVFKGSRPVHTKNLVLRVAKQSQNSKLKTQNYNSKLQNVEILKQVQDDNRAMKQSNNETMMASRFGFVISNKISKLATRRNALKRQLRAIIEQELPNIKPGYDVVIMVKLDFGYPYDQKAIKEQVEKGLKIAGVMNK